MPATIKLAIFDFFSTIDAEIVYMCQYANSGQG